MEVYNVLTPKAPSSAMSKAAAARPQAAERYRVVTADTALFGCAQPEEDCGIYQNDIASDRQKIWERLLAQCQETLRKDCSGVNLQFADMDTGKLPLLSTDGVQIIISKGFLERLASTKAVSYTHLDVYKRQLQRCFPPRRR